MVNKAEKKEESRPYAAESLFWLVLALFWLNASLSFQNLWPTPLVRLVPELAVELFAVLAAFGLLGLVGLRPSRWFVRLLALLWLVACLLRYAEVTAGPLFGRGLNIYWDLSHVPNLIGLFWRAAGPLQGSLAALGLLILLVLLYRLNRAALACLASAARGRGVLMAVLVGGLGLGAYASIYLPDPGAIRQAFAIPAPLIAAKHIGFAREVWRLRDAGPEELDALFGPEQSLDSDLEGFAGEDVTIVFLESYGTTLFDHDKHWPAAEPAFRAFETRLAESGWQVVSRRLTSPTFGGGSWWAHGTLLSGARLANQTAYNLFLTTGRETLVQRFKQKGYRALAYQPGIQRAWPEGAFFGFDRIYDGATLDYPGPDFGYWRIPDQFTLHRFTSGEAAKSEQPLFALVILIMSHMPFQPLPPFQPDWSQLDATPAYDSAEAEAINAEPPDWSDLNSAYVAGMGHLYDVLGDWLAEQVARPSLIVLVGDHQPPALVAGEEQPWTVPIHILSRNVERLAPFVALGYQPGLFPQPGSTRPMEGVFGDLLRAGDSRARIDAEQ